jgi:maltooligosyltrehalose trehalohydrolase
MTGAHIVGDKILFNVWAPLHEKMILHIIQPFEEKIEMQKNVDGFFSFEVAAAAGCRYFFMPVGEKDFPDPASQFQPNGVHEASEIIDHSHYEWHDEEWKGIPFDQLILYELHVGTFTEEGTFESAIDKLEHLIDIGVNAIELMPVSQFPGERNWGYDGVYPFAVQNSYGGPDGLKKLVDACHQKGIAIFLDVVFNHLGPEGNYMKQFGPYFTDNYKSPWGEAINFDGQWSDGVREFFSDNALYWFEYFHIDGLRFDAIHGVYDMSAIHFWQFMHTRIKNLEQKLGRTFYTIAESDLNDTKVINSVAIGGYGFTAQWLDDFHHALYTLVHEEGRKFYEDFGSMQQLAKAFKEGFVHSGEYVKFRKKKFGVSSAGISGNKFVVFIDNHDQAGNRATGNCLASLISFEEIKLASAVYMLSPYIPMLFMGEEYGDDSPFLFFISHSDAELIEAVRQGRKKTFAHGGEEFNDPFDEKSFYQSKLQWQKKNSGKHKLLLQWYKTLIRLRKEQKALQNFNKNNVWVNVNENLVVLNRRSENFDEEIICFFNFSDSDFCGHKFDANTCWKKLLDSNEARWMINEVSDHTLPGIINEEIKIELPPLTVAVYAKRI